MHLKKFFFFEFKKNSNNKRQIVHIFDPLAITDSLLMTKSSMEEIRMQTISQVCILDLTS